MTELCRLTALTLGAVTIAGGQGRPLDWPFFGGDAQRSGWEKSDLRITKENVKDFQLVLKHKLETKGGPLSLTPPVVLGNLISYKGFKELGFLAGSSGEMWSLDLDIDRMFWHKQLTSTSKGCEGGAMATPTLTPPPDFTARPRPTAAPAPSPSPGIPASPAGSPATAAPPSILGGTGFGAPRPAFALAKDGKLHVLNTSTGDDLTPPIPFVPANSRASSLMIADGALYTTTADCAGRQGTVWALDLNGAERKVTSYQLKGSAAGLAGLSVGRSHTVYVAGSDGSLTALASRTLAETSKTSLKAAAPPLIFTAKDRDMLIVPGADGRLSLLDSQQLSAPLFQTPPIGKLWGGISSWVDADETRYVAVPVWGPVDANIAFPLSDGAAPDGSVAVFKVEDAKLTPAWISHNLQSPEPPVITSGVVFALAAGGPHATLFAFDGASGKEMYSTKNQVTAPANLNGMSLANGRVFFTTTDGTLYGFGIFLERLGALNLHRKAVAIDCLSGDKVNVPIRQCDAGRGRFGPIRFTAENLSTRR